MKFKMSRKGLLEAAKLEEGCDFECGAGKIKMKTNIKYSMGSPYDKRRCGTLNCGLYLTEEIKTSGEIRKLICPATNRSQMFNYRPSAGEIKFFREENKCPTNGIENL